MRNYYLQFEEHGAADNQSLTVNGGAAAVHQVQMSQFLQQHIGRSLPLPVSSGKSSTSFITSRRVGVTPRHYLYSSQTSALRDFRSGTPARDKVSHITHSNE